MATHRFSIGNFSLFPPNEFAIFLPYSIIDTGAPLGSMVINFDPDNDGEVNGGFDVPKNWVSGSTNLIIKWSTEGTTGNFDIEFLHRSVADGERIDIGTSPATRTDTLIAAAPGTAGELEVDTISITDTDWAVDEFVQFQLRRDADDATNDTLASAAQVFSLQIEYVDA